MNDNQHKSGMEEQIKKAVSEALQTGDFANLNDLVSQTVTEALTDAGKHFAQNVNIHANNQYKTPKRPTSEKQEPAKQTSKARTEANVAAQKPQLPRQNVKMPPVPFKEVGSVSSVLYQVFGGIGFGISSMIAVLRLPGTFYGSSTLAGWIVNILFMAVFFNMIHIGSTKMNRLKRAKRYLQLCRGRMYGQVEQLARDTGNSVRYVIKDLRKMLSLGIFPEGHLDSQKTCFMLNDAVHQQYLEAENNRLLRENSQKEEQKAAASANTDSAPDSVSPENELNAMISEGMECIRKLHTLNDKIPGEVISQKLYRLENLLKDIFDNVRKHPEQMHRMHTMMDYYLPTTLKLVEKYEEFDRVSVPGKDIIDAKAEIERTLDIINQAFQELLNNLFQDAVFDATTDAQVLQTMLARDGLTKDTEINYRREP